MQPPFNIPSASRLSITRQFQREERWVKHYSSCHVILLVGEGDFSFSVALAKAFGSASNIVATSLDSHDNVVTKYAKAKSNLETLEKMGATILHGVDATKMKFHVDLKMKKFDRIVYNFPHAGFKWKEDHTWMIDLHQQLVHGFFNNASQMIKSNGEVHVTHKTESPYNKWKLDELASKNSLVLIECADFNISDYPGYSNKRGDGVNCDQPFRLGECCTFKFGTLSYMIYLYGRDDGLRNAPGTKHSFDIQYLQAEFMPHMEGRPRLTCSPPTNGTRNALAIDEDHMPMRACARPGIQTSSFQQSNFSIRSEGVSRWIGSEPLGVFEDHSPDLENIIRRFGPDYRYAEQKVRRSDYQPRIEINNSYSVAFGHSKDLRNNIRRYGTDCSVEAPTKSVFN